MGRRAGSVVRYEGNRGVVLRIRYRDADGERVTETLGSEADGWTDKKAEAALRHRLVDVEREHRRKLKPATFDAFAREWLSTYPDARGLKASTRESYHSILERHLIPALGEHRLESIDLEVLERYIAEKRRASKTRKPLGPASINRHLNLLNLIFSAAVKRGSLRPGSNPVSLVERPKEPRRRWTILTPAEITRISKAFEELAEKAEGEEREWIAQARVVFLVVISCGLRRGELLGLRWGNVDLVDMVIRVEEAIVRGRRETPKSEAGERTIALAQVIAGELFEHRGRSRFDGDAELVFCHVTTGAVFDHKRYAETLAAARAKAKVDRPMRPFHDGRHTAITHDAAAGNGPVAVMTRAGHSDFKTTQRYIDLAGETFREEADRLSARLFGASGKSSGKSAEDEPAEGAIEAEESPA